MSNTDKPDIPDIIGFIATLALVLAANGLEDSFVIAFVAYLGIIICCWFWKTTPARKEGKDGG